jgi:hypothetical protein
LKHHAKPGKSARFTPESHSLSVHLRSTQFHPMTLHPPIAMLATWFCLASATLHAQPDRTFSREFFVSPTGSDAKGE